MRIKFYLRGFYRHLIHQKEVSIIGIGSLVLGIAVALLIGLWTISELSFNSFHEHKEDIYLAYVVEKEEGSVGTFRQLGDRWKETIPEVKEVCRVVTWGLEVRVNNHLIEEVKHVIQAENNFFSFFTFPLKEGNPLTCLKEPGNIVISETLAKRWFGNESPLDKIIEAEGKVWKISAVMHDFPYYSSLKADIVMAFYGKRLDPACTSNYFETYLYAPAISNTKLLEEKMTRVSDEHEEVMKEMEAKCKLLRLTSMHLGEEDITIEEGSRVLLIVLSVTALVILILACINFMNLFVSRAFFRAREIGIMKAFGAGRGELALTLWGEILGYILLATVCAIGVVWWAIPWFNKLANYQLTFDFTSPILYLYLLGVLLFTLLVAGVYPALYISRQTACKTLYGENAGKKFSVLQQSLLVFQLTVSIVFLICIFVIQKQVNYMINYDLGYNRENVVYLPNKHGISNHYTTIRNELLKESTIKDVALRNSLPMYWADGYPVKKIGSERRVGCELVMISENYFDMMEIQFVEGENPFRGGGGKEEIVIDELAVKCFELEKPLGAVLNVWGTNFVVKGVVKTVKSKGLNMNDESPLLYMNQIHHQRRDHFYHLMCKIEGDPQNALKVLQREWEKYIDRPFEYEFLDDVYRQLYDSEIRLGYMFSWAMAIMFLLSLCGLLAMTYHTMHLRRREIGIRKINGAVEKELIIMLNLYFVRIVLVAWSLACVIACVFLDYWLEQFVVQTTLAWWVFAGVGGGVLLVILLTVSYLTIRTSQVNPIDVLKSE